MNQHRFSANKDKKTAADKADSTSLGAMTQTRSSGPEQSINRILDATLAAASKQGLRSLSMSSISRVAGVARGTLYRYFPTKEILLESLAQRTRERFEDGINEAVSTATNGRESLVALVEFLAHYSSETMAEYLLEAEPHFFLEFLRRYFPHYSEVMANALSLFFDELEESLGCSLDRVLCAELILRINTSYVFVPSQRSTEQLLDSIMNTLNRMALQT